MECNLGIMSLRLHAWSKIHLYKQDFRLGKGIKLNVFQQQMDQTTKRDKQCRYEIIREHQTPITIET